jgi:Fe-S-cluster containining protein
LAHDIVIVDDLYDRKPVLRTFIRNYERWRHKGEAISKALDETRARAFASSMSIHEIIAVTRPLSMRYLESRIPCPFLEEEACLIYAVRPFPCSGQFSVSPPEWCSPAAAQDAVIHQLVTGDEDLLKFLELAGPGLMVSEMTLPTLIYRLLTEGASSVIRTGLREGADPGRDAMTKL